MSSNDYHLIIAFYFLDNVLMNFKNVISMNSCNNIKRLVHTFFVPFFSVRKLSFRKILKIKFCISQTPGRKQLAHSNEVTEENLIKKLLTKE